MTTGLVMPPRRIHAKADALASYWSDVRPKSRHRMAQVVPPPPVERFVEWGASFGDPTRFSLLVIPGDAAHRADFLQRYLSPEFDPFRPDCSEDLTGPLTRSWISDGIVSNVTRRFESLPFTLPPAKGTAPVDARTWHLIWALVLSGEFLVSEPLRDLVDQEFRLVHSVYRALWEARFLARETQDPKNVQVFVDCFTRWIVNDSLSEHDVSVLSSLGIRKPIVYPSERFDVLLFLLTLAEQNALVNRVLLMFDDLEHMLRPEHRPMLRQLETFLESVDRWVTKMGCPVGAVIGLDATRQNLTLLKKLNPKLHTRVEAGLEWIR